MRTTRWVLAGAVLAGSGWAAGRIARGPARVDIRAFDAARAARLELDWWIVHRDTAEQARGPQELERALAELAAELYQVPAERLGVHAERRAEAMTIRDRRAQEPGGVAEADWDRIQSLLRLAWRALATELRAAVPAR
jgi:hypothetical protein